MHADDLSLTTELLAFDLDAYRSAAGYIEPSRLLDVLEQLSNSCDTLTPVMGGELPRLARLRGKLFNQGFSSLGELEFFLDAKSLGGAILCRDHRKKLERFYRELSVRPSGSELSVFGLLRPGRELEPVFLDCYALRFGTEEKLFPVPRGYFSQIE